MGEFMKNQLYENNETDPKINYLKSVLDNLRNLCEKKYKYHSYYGRDGVDNYKIEPEEEKNIDQYFQEIIQTKWTDNRGLLRKIKAEAYYLRGAIYKEIGDYDRAVEYLKKAEKFIQKESLQEIIPIIYAKTEIYLAKCYIEKHGTFSKIDEYHKKAEMILSKDISKFIEESYKSKLKIQRLKLKRLKLQKLEAKLELTLQQAIAEMDPFGQKNADIKNQEWKYMTIYKGETNSFVEKAESLNIYKYLKDSQDLFDKLEELSKESSNETLKPDKLWIDKQNDTLIATKANFLKQIYFDLRIFWENNNKDENQENQDGNGKEIKKQEEENEDRYIKIISEILMRYLQRNNNENNAQINTITSIETKKLSNIHAGKLENKKEIAAFLLVMCFEIVFNMFKEGVEKNNKSTICLGNIILLLYDYQYPFDKQENDQSSKNLIKNALDYLNTNNKDFSKENYVNKFFSKEVDASIDENLKLIYYTEANNMFALNIDSCMQNNKKIEIDGNVYSSLRYSSLKRYFNRLDQYFDPGNENNYYLKLQLILLYNEVISYMEKAVVDVNSTQWKDRLIGHYTRTCVLDKLINNKKNSRLRLNNVRHLNDSSEGTVFIKQTFRESEKKFLNEIIDAYSEKKQGTYRSSVYMGSFTSQYDQLNMWTRYGDNGKGVSLQLNVSESFDSTVKVPLEFAVDEVNIFEMEDKRYPLYTVLYLPVSNISDEEIDKLINRCKSMAMIGLNDKKQNESKNMNEDQEWWYTQSLLLGEYKKLRKNMNDILNEIDETVNIINQINSREYNGNTKQENFISYKNEVKNTVMLILDLIRFLIKSDDFIDEREYRLIQYSSEPKYVEMPNSTPLIYIDLEKQLAYKKICYGPCIKDFSSIAAYGINIRKRKKGGKRGEAWNLESKQSQIAYVGTRD